MGYKGFFTYKFENFIKMNWKSDLIYRNLTLKSNSSKQSNAFFRSK